LHEKNLRTSPDRVAIVDNHHFDATKICSVSQFGSPECPSVNVVWGL
jgi:hypothetical protein